MTALAQVIQAGERAAGDPDFYGYLWQGKDESLTVNVMEWIFSYGGGSVIEPDGQVSINNPKAIDALNRARQWLGTISPVATLSYAEEECRNTFQDGHSAFMRNWPYVYSLADKPDSRISGKFSVTELPKGGDAGTHAGSLGGWSLMVSKDSRHPEVAADFVKYFSSAEVEKQVALELCGMPSRPALYQDQDILKNILGSENYPRCSTMLWPDHPASSARSTTGYLISFPTRSTFSCATVTPQRKPSRRSRPERKS